MVTLTDAEFDQIADVYDETRKALETETLVSIEQIFQKYGCKSILEIGVGTGRVSLPLFRAGYDMTGCDISRRMMEKARLKGLGSLFLASGSSLPFKENSFDAALLAHVFHLLDDPMAVVREAAKTSRVGVFALIRKRDGGRPWSFSRNYPDNIDASLRRDLDERRERLRKIAQKYGYNWESARRFPHWRREHEILETNPPDDLVVASDVVINDTYAERIARFEKGANTFVLNMPEEMKMEIVREMRANIPTATPRSRHEIHQIALWKRDTLLR